MCALTQDSTQSRLPKTLPASTCSDLFGKDLIIDFETSRPSEICCTLLQARGALQSLSTFGPAIQSLGTGRSEHRRHIVPLGFAFWDSRTLAETPPFYVEGGLEALGPGLLSIQGKSRSYMSYGRRECDKGVYWAQSHVVRQCPSI